MIGGVARVGGLPGLPGRVNLSAGVAFCHVKDSRWVTRLAGVEFMSQLTPFGGGFVYIIKSDSKKPEQ